MAVQTITYGDKSYLNQNADIPATNKVQDTDMNEIKAVVNNNATILQGTTTYSLNEIDTGKTWIDGKPIYRKVYNVGALPNSTDKNIDSELTDVSIKRIYGYAVASDNTTIALPHASNGEGYCINVYFNNRNNITISTGVDRSYFYGYVVLEYTKTTD